ncbi:hypothetical protein [Streptomyces sp. NPDC126514]|uniref:hypothetical protein n=1 Tax=Streptomyces sp. NPDC126514 TaxID=3155210 RepID=UPI0033273656
MSVLDPKFATVKQAVKDMVVPENWLAFRNTLCADRADLGPLLWGQEGEGGLRGLLAYILGADPGEGIAVPGNASSTEPPLALPDWANELILLSALTLTVRAVRHTARAGWLEAVGSGNLVLGEAQDAPGGLLFWLEAEPEPTFRFDVQPLQHVPAKGTVLSAPKLYYEYKPPLWARQVADGQGGTEVQYSGDEHFSGAGMLYADGVLAMTPAKGTVLSVRKTHIKDPKNPDGGVWAGKIADGVGGSETQYSVDPKNFDRDNIRAAEKARKAAAARRRKQDMTFTDVRVGDTKPLHNEYTPESDRNGKVAYFSDETLPQRRAVMKTWKEEEITRHDRDREMVKLKAIMVDGEFVEPGGYGWVLDEQGELYLFDDQVDAFHVPVSDTGIPLTFSSTVVRNLIDKRTEHTLKALSWAEFFTTDTSEFIVMSKEFKLRHSSPTGGRPVQCAGMCTVGFTPDGEVKIVEIDNSSGHYRPFQEHLQAAMHQLNRKGFLNYGVKGKNSVTTRADAQKMDNEMRAGRAIVDAENAEMRQVAVRRQVDVTARDSSVEAAAAKARDRLARIGGAQEFVTEAEEYGSSDRSQAIKDSFGEELSKQRGRQADRSAAAKEIREEEEKIRRGKLVRLIHKVRTPGVFEARVELLKKRGFAQAVEDDGVKEMSKAEDVLDFLGKWYSGMTGEAARAAIIANWYGVVTGYGDYPMLAYLKFSERELVKAAYNPSSGDSDSSMSDDEGGSTVYSDEVENSESSDDD